MKKLLTIIILLALHCGVNAQTSIPAGSISTATWTQAGSPYLINGNITISNYLKIEPGVEVILQGFYQIKVSGNLRAIGTSSQRITFKINDTTGWHNDISPVGGWRGIYFDQLFGTDSSELRYCVIKDVKHGVNAPQNDNAAIFSYYRGFRISYCEFYHNQSSANQSVGNIIVGSLNQNKTFELDHCNIHDNDTRVGVFKMDTYVGGFLKIHDNRFHHNTGAGAVFTLWSEMIFENNELDSNTCTAVNFGTLRVDGGHNIIRNNKLHHNSNLRMAAIACTMGKTTIEKNLICNNQMLDASCGATDGGAAIHVSHNNNAPWDSTEYIIRDNIIANNFADYFGAGVYIFSCKVWISNNHFIKNKTTMDGAAINAFGNDNQIYMQNNIFYGNESTNYGLKKDVRIAIGNKYSFDYNWMEYPFYNMVDASLINRIGDTIHNVIGSTPALLNPTTICGPSDNALLKDFHLTSSSTCINAGDIQNITTSATDFYGTARISGPKIDIGANEFVFNIPESVKDVDDFFVQVYPNPSNNVVIIEMEKASDYTITLLDFSGKKVFQHQEVSSKISVNVDAIPSGIYVLTVADKEGKMITRKISKN
ncbi:MAG: T9SS type A sorting domain-containing protein [Chitinophagaceae bacterium]